MSEYLLRQHPWVLEMPEDKPLLSADSAPVAGKVSTLVTRLEKVAPAVANEPAAAAEPIAEPRPAAEEAFVSQTATAPAATGVVGGALQPAFGVDADDTPEAQPLVPTGDQDLVPGNASADDALGGVLRSWLPPAGSGSCSGARASAVEEVLAPQTAAAPAANITTIGGDGLQVVFSEDGTVRRRV